MWVPPQLPSYQWGFLFENVHFTPFDSHNNELIELEYRSRGEHFSHSFDIIDSHLKYPARIYFGVAQTHLRMPGTRYYVRRREIQPQHQQQQQQSNIPPVDSYPMPNQLFYAIPKGMWPSDEIPLGVFLPSQALAVPWQGLIGQLYRISVSPNNVLEHASQDN